MDPNQFTPSSSNSTFLPIGGITFIPGIFGSVSEGDKFLNTLDSDTRDYVLKHTDDFRTRQDIIDCVNSLHSKS